MLNLLKSPYLRDISFQASGNSIAQLIGIFSLPILTRLFSPQDFAVLNLFTQVVMFLGIVLTFRLEYFIALPRKESDSQVLILSVCLIGIALAFLWSIIVYLLRFEISSLLDEPLLSEWLILAPITALFMSISISIQHFHQRKENYKISGFSEIVSKLGYAMSGIIGFMLFPKAIGLMLALIISNISKGIYLLLKLGKSIEEIIFPKDIKFGHAKNIIKEYFGISGSLVISHIMLTVTTAIPIVFTSNFYGKEVLGQFTLVFITIFLPSSLIGIAIGQVYYQRAAKKYANGERFSELWKETAKFLIKIAAPIYILIGLLSPYIYPIIFGEEWYDAGKYASVVSIAAFFSFISAPLDRACIITGRGWYVIAWHSLRASTTFLVAYLASKQNWDFDYFLLALVMQMILMYLIDYIANWHFSKTTPLIEE